MAKKTIVVCDNCGNRMSEEAKPVVIVGFKRDLCSTCVSLILEGRFVSVLELEAEQRKPREENDDSQAFAAIRHFAADGIERYAEGADVRPVFTRIAEKAAGR